MATLSGQTIANTFDSILHVEDDTAGLVATAVDSRVIQDGVGQSSALALATDSVRITSTNKLYFNDAGAEEIHSASDGHLEVNSGTTLDITAPTVDINASTAVTVDGPSVAISSTSASEPVLHITNTHAGATAGEIRFNKDSASGDDNDVMGTISWYGTDAGEATHERLAYMDTIITDSAAGSEASSMRFYVAENDATLTQGLALAGQADADGEIDVTIGAGASSTTTIAGDLAVTGSGPWTDPDGAQVFNDSGNDVDFRVESDDNTHMLFVDGGTNQVGIGTDSPANLLDLRLDGQVRISLFSGGSNNELLFYRNNNTIASPSNVAENNVIGQTRYYGYQTSGYHLGAQCVVTLDDSTADNDVPSRFGWWCMNDSAALTEHFRIDHNGNLTGTDTSIGAISDERLKENIVDYSGGLDIIKQLRPVEYNYKNPEHHKLGTLRGFIAQEVQAVDDYWVGQSSINQLIEGDEPVEHPDWEILEETDGKFMTSNISDKDTLYVSAIQELATRVEALENA